MTEDFEQPPLFDLGAGEALRDDGVAAAGSTTPGASAWRADAEAALEVLAARRTEFSADDLVAAIGPPPVPNQVGAVFNAAAKFGVIAWTSKVTQGKRPQAHARLQKVWIGAE